MNWEIGDTGYYLLPRDLSVGRLQDLYLSVVVISISKNRITIRPQSGGAHRNTTEKNLVRTAPEGAWIK